MSLVGYKVLLMGKFHGSKHPEAPFKIAAIRLRKQGYAVVNPYDVPMQPGWDYVDWLAYLQQELTRCDAVYFLTETYAEVISEVTGERIGFHWFDNTAQIFFLLATILKKQTLSEDLTGEGGHL